MKFKKLVFNILNLFIIIFCCNNSFGMQENIEQEKQIYEKIIENQRTRGDKILTIIVRHINNKDSLEEKDNAIKKISKFVVKFGLNKAIKSRQEIIGKLKKIKYVGSLIAGFVDKDFKENFSRYSENVNKEKENIEIEFQKNLRKILQNPEARYRNSDKIVNNYPVKFIEFIEKDMEDFDTLEQKNPKVVRDILCFGHKVAASDENFFAYFVEKTDVFSDQWLLYKICHSFLSKALSHHSANFKIEQDLNQKYGLGTFKKNKLDKL